MDTKVQISRLESCLKGTVGMAKQPHPKAFGSLTAALEFERTANQGKGQATSGPNRMKTYEVSIPATPEAICYAVARNPTDAVNVVAADVVKLTTRQVRANVLKELMANMQRDEIAALLAVAQEELDRLKK